MDASQYRDLGYECLRKSALQVGTDDFGCIEADLEQSIVNSVRAQYVAVCDEYEDLISSWKGTELDWKRKFILRALKVNPNTGKPYKVANLRLMKKVQKPGASYSFSCACPIGPTTASSRSAAVTSPAEAIATTSAGMVARWGLLRLTHWSKIAVT